MLETLLNGGPFMMVLLIIVGSIIFISVKNQIIRSNLEMIYNAIFYGSKSWSETC